MSEQQITPISPKERIGVVDVLRGLAVCGIFIGNMQWFSGYGMMPPAVAATAPQVDHAVSFLVHFLIEGKFYSIFSFLFGFGFALQIARAEERGDLKAAVFKRRLMWLFVIGVLHATLLWAGDILSVYAVTGFVLLLFRRKPDRSLIKWAVILMIVPVVTYLLLYGAFVAFAPKDAIGGFEAAQVEMWNNGTRIVGGGSWWEITRGYNLQYLAGRWIGLVIQMRFPKILAMFLLGLYAYRKGFFQNLSAHAGFIRKVLVYGLLLGIVGNVALAAFAGNEAPFPPSLLGALGVIGYAFGVPALALAIIAMVATGWQNDLGKKVLGVVAPVGRMALTNYLFQTLVGVTIFYGYGFGRYGQIGATTATLIALGVFAVQVVLSTLWLKFFAYGPMEWIWRQLTYRKRLPLRLRSAAAAA